MSLRTAVLFLGMALLLVWTGYAYNANLALTILNMGLISAVMALGVNIQWGYAGLFNIGVMGFVAVGGLAAVLAAMPPVPEAWAAGGARLIGALIFGAASIAAAVFAYKRLQGRRRTWAVTAILLVGFVVFRQIFDSAVIAIEAIDPSRSGYLGGLGLPILAAWPLAALMGAGIAWLIGKVALGLRSDYLAIATLGIAEIILAVMKNEEWLDRGVKNVNGLPRPVPYETALQQDPSFVERAANLGFDPVFGSTLYVKISYSLLFTAVLVILLVLAQLAWNSPWGRMMRAIRDNEISAAAMGKNVTKRHLQIFVLGSAICAMGGAMLTTLDGQLVPTSYQPLRFTFLIWVMVIIGGSGNNFGSILGGLLIWWLWIMVEPLSQGVMAQLASALPDGSWLQGRIKESAPHTRLFLMGILLLVVLRFSPRGLLPEK